MTTRTSAPSFAILFVTLFPGCLLGQDAARLAAILEGKELYSTVSVLAFDVYGHPLGPPGIKLFESVDDRRNLADKFRNGVARGIPYGEYRIEARLQGYRPDSKVIPVYGPHINTVLGLTFSLELPLIPPDLPGQVVGQTPRPNTFARLVGIYNNVAIDSLVDADGRFTLFGISDGKYLLLVVGESGVLASRPVTIPYTGPPLRIKLNSR
jgi:hypothetical protein